MQSQKVKSLLASMIFIALLAAIVYFVNGPLTEQAPSPDRIEERDPPTRGTYSELPGAKSREHSTVGFASKQKLVQHYQKHGREFGKISLEEYLSIAQTLRDRPVSRDVLEYIRPDGIVSRFEKSTGTFIAFNPAGIIRTCFRPNDGLAYFERQKFKDH